METKSGDDPRPDTSPYARLRAVIEANRTGILPPMAELARTLGVSQMTVWRAARRLRAEGLLHFRRGGKIQVPGKAPPPEPPRPAPGETLYRGLRQAILSNRYHAGQAMPKRDYLARSGRVSSRTVAAVCARLEAEGLVHRQGRRMMVGARPPELAGAARPRWILVVTARSPDWRMLGESRRVSEFCRNFAEQAEKFGVRLVHACTEPNERYPELDIPHGREAILAWARRMGPGYLGALFCADRSEIEDLEKWFSTLLGLGRPVVWFNRFPHPLRSGFRPPGLFQCRNEDGLAAAAAVAHLAELGHRRLAFAYDPFDEISHAWMSRRAGELERAATAHPSKPEILRLSKPDFSWENPRSLEFPLESLRGLGLPALDQAMEYFRSLPARVTAPWIGAWPESSRATPRNRTFLAFSRAYLGVKPPDLSREHQDRAALIWTGLHLLPCLRDRGITALIAANDGYALVYQRWFRAVGIPVPERLSLLGFDNSYRLGISNLTTVDFGFGLQGYQAFHLFLGDLPWSTDAKGLVLAQPFVAPRGTTAAPGKAEPGPVGVRSPAPAPLRSPIHPPDRKPFH